MSRQSTVTTSGELGGVIASVLSYLKWHSVKYAILHFFCGWVYVIYHLIAYGVPKQLGQ